MLGRSAVVTDTGRKRRRNEDAFVRDPPLFAVADGVGGAAAGELASKLAATALSEGPVDGGGEERVVQLIHEANRRVYERALEDAGASGMGTTVTVALVEDERVWFGHVGDSRAYLVRGGKLEQLTQDHSLVAELVRANKISPEEAEAHPQRSVITRALGSDPDVDVDTFQIPTQAGDVFLLCSDGLTDMVGDERIRELVERHRGDLQEVARALVNAANKGGGEDNITVVAFEIADESEDLGETAQYAAPVPDQPEPDEEDTLTPADRVPTVDTFIVPPEDAAKRSAAPPKPRRRGRWIAFLVFLLALLAAAAVVVWFLLR